ncbi:MAG TPA: dephospho-CoA kinase [Opitutaceae bacterium]|nr:dephospho-CoA kinase [Opitutaceae bacterium]
MMSIGITGGMGCGKSTVAKLMEKKGFERIDSDAIVREKVLTLASVRDQIRGHFGDAVMNADGTVDRAKLGARVFADDAELAWLEELTHPHVFACWREAFAAAKRDVVVEVPLLFEKNLENWFDFTVCVACAPAQQLARLEQRGLPHALAEQRISKQLPLARKIELADFVLWNDGSAEFLENQVDHLVNALPVAR